RADLVDPDDVLALNLRRRARLALEAFARAGPRQLLRRKELDRDGPTERDIGGAHDDAHAAGSDDRLDAILAGDDLSRTRELHVRHANVRHSWSRGAGGTRMI